MLSVNLPSILTPDPGLLIWMLVAFLVVFGLVAKYGFPVIIKMVDERKRFIDESLTSAHEANERLAGIKAESERILKEARTRQAEILEQAQKTSDQIIAEAKSKAQDEAAKVMLEAKAQLAAEKENALRDVRQTVAEMSLVIAEKVVRQKLNEGNQQQQLIERTLDEMMKPHA